MRCQRVLIQRSGEQAQAGRFPNQGVARRQFGVLQPRRRPGCPESGSNAGRSENRVPILSQPRLYHPSLSWLPCILNVRRRFVIRPPKQSVSSEHDSAHRRTVLAEILVAGSPRVLPISDTVEIDAHLQLMRTFPMEHREEKISQELLTPRLARRVHI